MRRTRIADVLLPRVLWQQRIESTPDRPFLLDERRTWTFAEADERKRRIAGGLHQLGVRQGSRVLVGLGNRIETVLVHHALAQLGAVLVPLLPRLGAPEAQYQCEHSEGQFLIVDQALAEVVAPHLDGLTRIDRVVVGDAPRDLIQGRSTSTLDELLEAAPRSPAPLHDYDDRSPWAILYTSGSMGRPKGVILPAGAFVTGGGGYAERFGIRASDNYVLATPLAHAVGALTAQSVALHTGSRLTVLDRFSPSRWWQQVEMVGGTVSVLFPAQLNLLLEVDEGTPAVGATPFRLAMTHTWNERFRERFGVELGLCWGMTETGVVSAGSYAGYRGERGESYVGGPWPNAELAVFDEGFQRLPAGAAGEIALRHPHVMLGYLNDSAATEAVMTDGWVRSGDRGWTDDDGHLHFVGRMKNVINRGGENIGAEEVERVLAAHPAVAEALVFAVPDRIRTEEVASVVALREGATVEPPELTRAAEEQLAHWKVPRYVLVWPGSLPRLANGKLDRTRIRAAFDDAAAWDRQAEQPTRAPRQRPVSG